MVLLLLVVVGLIKWIEPIPFILLPSFIFYEIRFLPPADIFKNECLSWKLLNTKKILLLSLFLFQICTKRKLFVPMTEALLKTKFISLDKCQIIIIIIIIVIIIIIIIINVLFVVLSQFYQTPECRSNEYDNTMFNFFHDDAG